MPGSAPAAPQPGAEQDQAAQRGGRGDQPQRDPQGAAPDGDLAGVGGSWARRLSGDVAARSVYLPFAVGRARSRGPPREPPRPVLLNPLIKQGIGRRRIEMDTLSDRSDTERMFP